MQHVNHTLKGGACRIGRVLDGGDTIAEIQFQLAQCLIKIGLFMIHLVGDKNHRFVEPLHAAPLHLCTDLHTVLRIQHHHRSIRHAQSTDNLAHEIIETRAVYHIDFTIFPCSIHGCGINGVLTFQLHIPIIGNCVFILHTSATADYATVKCHGFRQSCFTRTSTSQECHVSDFTCLIYLHLYPFN